ncbi:MAG: hypothetical protein WBW31_23950 [Candidatus Sulfotelmatobacter sp.]
MKIVTRRIQQIADRGNDWTSHHSHVYTVAFPKAFALIENWAGAIRANDYRSDFITSPADGLTIVDCLFQRADLANDPSHFGHK